MYSNNSDADYLTSSGLFVELWPVLVAVLTQRVHCACFATKSQMHADMVHTVNSWSVDWVLSHWAHFTVLRFIFVYVCKCIFCMTVYCMNV